MSLRPEELGGLLLELQPLVGRRASKVWTPTSTAVLLRLKGRDGQDDLLVEVAHPRGRLGVVRERPRGEPGDFQQQLRATIEGCVLTQLWQPLVGDRVISLDFAHREGGARLLIELLGSQGQLLLLDAEDRLVAAARPSRLGGRGLKIGEPYELPARRQEEGERAPAPSRWEATGSGEHGDFPISARLEAHYAPLDREATLQEERRTLRRSLTRAHKRQAKIVGQLEASIAAAAQADRIQQDGELLKTALGTLRRGQTEVRVRDYYDPEGGERTLPLDPKLGPKENLEAIFRKARKLLRGAEVSRERLAKVQQSALALATLLEEVEGADELEHFEALWKKARPLGVKRPAAPVTSKASGKGSGKKGESTRKPYRSFVSSSGDRILVGRSARDNHALTFQVARGRDVWLHVRDYPGSHVVIRGEGGAAEVDPVSLVEAGLLAAHFSEGREAGPVEVSWTERKHLRHPPGSAPGLVSMAKARTLRVVPDEARLEALFGREE